MLPALTVRAARVGRPRAAAAALCLLLAVAAAGLSTRPALPSAAAPVPLAQRLAPSTWAFAVPLAWLAAPLADVRPGDRIDVLALKPGDRAGATAIALDLEVLSLDDRTLVVGAGASDATQLAVARATGQLIVPLLRSAR